MQDVLHDVLYLVASILFILGIKSMTHPRTAVRGNLLGASGMLVATIVVYMAVMNKGENLTSVNIGLILGAVAGLVLAVKIEMTAMPQLVAFFNGMGGLASLLVAGVNLELITGAPDGAEMIATAVSGLIGSVTFLGSMIAMGKLWELGFAKWELPLPTSIRHLLNALLILICLFCGYRLTGDAGVEWYLGISIAGCLLGFTLTSPIGGADMPVVIALLNSYSGLAASATGFVIGNNVLIVSGSLVGASGIILTSIMCKAMNRSLLNVLFGAVAKGEIADADEVYATVKSTSPEEVAMMLETAQRVVVVPGYGMAVAQAQRAVRDLATILEANDTEVEYAIHPVAGRMPGHMNVLLAEADVPYQQLKELSTINPTFDEVDISIVLGANDVVNPTAREEGSPIYGMPILDVDKSRVVIVIKRSLSPGYAGIPNPLFAQDNTLMLFGDGKDCITNITSAINT